MTFLHAIGDFLRSQLLQVPLWAAKCLFIGLFIAMMAWVVLIPPTRATKPDGVATWYEDLRIWAWLALLIQVAIYAAF